MHDNRHEMFDLRTHVRMYVGSVLSIDLFHRSLSFDFAGYL